MTSWATVQSALQSWVAAGAGVAVDDVIWEQQNPPRPSGPWASIKIITERKFGPDWIITEDAEDPQPGAEIRYASRGPREVVLSIQVYAGTAIGAESSFARLSNVVNISNLPTQFDALDAAGIGIASFEPVSTLGQALTAAKFEPRASTTCRFFTTSEVEEFGTFIEFLEITNLNTDETFFVPSDPP